MPRGQQLLVYGQHSSHKDYLHLYVRYIKRFLKLEGLYILLSWKYLTAFLSWIGYIYLKYQVHFDHQMLHYIVKMMLTMNC